MKITYSIVYAPTRIDHDQHIGYIQAEAKTSDQCEDMVFEYLDQMYPNHNRAGFGLYPVLFPVQPMAILNPDMDALQRVNVIRAANGQLIGE